MLVDVLVSGYARTHTDGLQHGVSIRISINLGKKNCCDPNLNEEHCRFTFFLFSDSKIYFLNGFDFYFY